jgi:hypothetical protein
VAVVCDLCECTTDLVQLGCTTVLVHPSTAILTVAVLTLSE